MKSGRPPAGARRGTIDERPRALWLALLVGMLLLVQVGDPRPAVLGMLLLLVPLLAVSLQRPTGPLVILSLLAAGTALRVMLFRAGFSDVLVVTAAAIRRVMSGGNPYGIGYPVAEVPGQPFPYGPLALLWYVPFTADPVRFELAVSVGILLLLALRGRPLGLAVYALAPPLVLTASDGANDTSAGLLLLAALLVVQRVPLWGGFLLGVAFAFKPYAAAWLPAIGWWSGAAGLAGFAAATLVFWGPALLAWGPASILTSIQLAEETHRSPYYSLAYVVQGLTRRAVSADAFDRLRLLLGAATAIISSPLIRSGGGMIVAGTLVFLVTLYSGYWSTYAYLAAIAPVICWHLDEWLALGARVRWPGDPAARLAAWADERWPVQHERRELPSLARIIGRTDRRRGKEAP